MALSCGVIVLWNLLFGGQRGNTVIYLYSWLFSRALYFTNLLSLASSRMQFSRIFAMDSTSVILLKYVLQGFIFHEFGEILEI